MASELFTVFGKLADDVAAGAGAGGISGECFILYSDIWNTPSNNLYVSGSVYSIRLPRGTKMKIWDRQLMNPQGTGFAVNVAVLDDVSGIVVATGNMSGVFVSGWNIIGQDALGSGCCTFKNVKCARPEHIIESPDNNKYVAFPYNVIDADGGEAISGQSIQYTIEITDEVQA